MSSIQLNSYEFKRTKSSYIIGSENWLIILLFLIISIIVVYQWPDHRLDWISYASCALAVSLANFITLLYFFRRLSKISLYFLIYRVIWSMSFSTFLVLSNSTFNNFLDINFAIFFYLLAIVDIFFNIVSKTITLEIGPGFMPRFH